MDHLPQLAALVVALGFFLHYVLVERPRLRQRIEDARHESVRAQIRAHRALMDARLASIDSRIESIERQFAASLRPHPRSAGGWR